MNASWILPCSFFLGSLFVMKSGVAQEQIPPFGLSAVPHAVAAQQPINLPETSLVGGCGSNIVLNGDFEANTAVGCDFNLDNPVFNAKVANATAFDILDEIDLMQDPVGCGFGPPPFSGTTKLGITRTSGPAPREDAFSLTLSTPVVVGERYRLQFFAIALTDFHSVPGAVEVGISTTATDFGALIATALPVVGSWSRFDFDVIAPVSGSFLTVRAAGNDGKSWSHIDAFSLVPVCNIVINGTFEMNNALGCDFNLTNAAFNATVPKATAFGNAQEIDVMKDPAGCGFGVPPLGGTTKVGIARQSVPLGLVDAFSLTLSEPVVAGRKYHLQFFAVAETFSIDTGAVEVGISVSATDFGTLIATGSPVAGAWSRFDFDIVAPVSGSFLTVREGDFRAWNHVDNFSLEPRLCDTSASWNNYGQGWPGTNGIIPSFTSSDDPRICGVFHLDLANSRGASTQSVLYLGLAAADIPSSYGGHLLVLPASVVLLTLPVGGASLPGSVPCDEALCGLDVYLQAWETDPGASKGLSFTRGLKLVLGS